MEHENTHATIDDFHKDFIASYDLPNPTLENPQNQPNKLRE